MFECVLSLDNYKKISASEPKLPTHFGSCGIWTHASYLNHSCIYNARRSFIGDMVIIRTTRDLEADTELTFWYENPGDTCFKKLQEKLKSWKRNCDCAMCNDARKTKAAVVTKQEDLLVQMKKLCRTSRSQASFTEKLERLLKSLDATYTRPATEVPRLLLWDPQLLFVQIFNSKSNAKKSLEWVSELLVALGLVVVGADLSGTSSEIEKWGLVVDRLVDVFLQARIVFKAVMCLADSMRRYDSVQ